MLGIKGTRYTRKVRPYYIFTRICNSNLERRDECYTYSNGPHYLNSSYVTSQAQAKASFQNMKSILTNKRLSIEVRKRVLQCYIEPILLYGCESWSMTKQTSTSIEAMEMWFLRRMLRVSWTENTPNLVILNTASSTRNSYEQHQEKTSIMSRPCDEKGKARAFVDNRKDRRKKKQMSSKNKNTRRYSSLAGKKHCGDVCGCKRSQKVEGHDRLRLQQTRQLMMMMMMIRHVLVITCQSAFEYNNDVTYYVITCKSPFDWVYTETKVRNYYVRRDVDRVKDRLKFQSWSPN